MRKRKSKGRHFFFFCGIIILAVLALDTFILPKITVEEQVFRTEVGEPITDIRIWGEIFERQIDATRFFEPQSQVDYNHVGRYEIQCISKLLKKEVTITVDVVDTTPPVITLEGPTKQSLTSIYEYVEAGFYATDNYHGDVTEFVEIKIDRIDRNKHMVTYTVQDGSGNLAYAYRELDVCAGTVYLTFDDGPSKSITPMILDILKENDVKATFFVVGFDRDKDEIVKRMHEEGHTIGIHGLSHEYSQVYKSIGNLMNNFYLLEDLVFSITGENSKIIRFPGGSSNTVSRNYKEGIMTEAVEEVTNQGYKYFDWNVDSQDAGGADTAIEIYDNVIAGIKPKRNNVVLMHDSAGHGATLEALEWMIDYCLENDYIFQPLTIDTDQVKHNVAN